MDGALALIGVILTSLIGWLIGVMLEHPHLGGLQFLGALIGVMVALDVIIFSIALRAKE